MGITLVLALNRRRRRVTIEARNVDRNPFDSIGCANRSTFDTVFPLSRMVKGD
jgi:hypothetical protein